jgi:hypothetical protein
MKSLRRYLNGMKSKVYASRPMKKNERHQAILDRAFALARSGKYERWLQIEWDLRADGFPEARQVLDSEFLRESR